MATFLIHLLQTCKPDFVSRFATGWLSFIWLLHYCNNLAAYPSASGEQPLSNPDTTGKGTLIYVALQYTRFTRNYNYL